VNERALYALVTLAIIGAAALVGNAIRRRIIIYQERRLAGWDGLDLAERIERLKVMKDYQIRDSARRWMTGFVTIVAFGWFVPSALWWLGDATEDIAQLGEQREADRIAGDLASCRVRNNGARANRQASMQDIGATSRNLLTIGVTQERVEALAEDRLAAIPPVEETDRDCNGNGVIGDEGDYPAD
jgi:hypothetical protein